MPCWETHEQECKVEPYSTKWGCNPGVKNDSPIVIFCSLLILQGFETNMKVARLLLPSILSSSLFILPVASAQSISSPCIPGISSNPLVMENLCNEPPKAEAIPAVRRTNAPQQGQPMLMLTADDINSMVLDDPPVIRFGDAWVFEANRSDFILEIYFSNGREIVVQPLTLADARNIAVSWRKGRVRLDHAEIVNQHMVGMRVAAIHETDSPLLFRAIKIDRKGRVILELEKSQGQKPKIPEPPMSYPPDPHVMTASATRPDIWGRRPDGAFLEPNLPIVPIHSMMLQSAAAGSSNPNHFKWNGKELDAETGLYNFGARYYSPALGRFVTPDPTILSRQRLFDPQQWNMYAYARNNPLKYTDPDGRELQLATGMSRADEQRVTKALVEVYRKPGGAQRIEHLAGSDIKYTVGSGDLKGEGYGLTRAKGKLDPATGKVDRSNTSVSITVDLDQKDKDKADFEQGIRKTAPPSEENTMTEEVVHADIFDQNPDAQRGKSPDQKEADAKPGIDEISKQKKGDAGKAKDRVNDILHPDKKKPQD